MTENPVNASQSERWIHIRFARVIILVREVPVRLRWKLRQRKQAGRKTLCLVSPRGQWWHLKVQGGWYIKRLQPKPLKEKTK